VAPTGRILVKFDIGNIFEIYRGTKNFVKAEQKYQTLCMKTQVNFIVAIKV
jgi:hypothetical protein